MPFEGEINSIVKEVSLRLVEFLLNIQFVVSNLLNSSEVLFFCQNLRLLDTTGWDRCLSPL